MLCIKPDAAPFALTPNNEVPKPIRDTAYWDDDGDVLLVTKDGIVFFLRMNLLLRYSETIRSLLGHVAGVPQEGLWTPVLELECTASELRAVLEYLLLQEQETQPSIDSLARYAVSAYTLGIKTLDDAALAGLLTYTRDRLNAYARWEGFAEFPAPPLHPVRAILAGRALPEPASSILSVAFVDLSVFGTAAAAATVDEAALYPPGDPISVQLRGLNDADTVALLRERHSELVESLLRLAGNFGRRRSLAKVGRPCCNFEGLTADHAPDLQARANAAVKGRSALSIITAVGAELEEARSWQAPASNGSHHQQAGQQPPEHDDKSRCESCLAELHQGMKRLYRLWWEDAGRLLMGEPQDGCSSVWDDVGSSLSAPQTPVPPNQWRGGLRHLLHQIGRAFVGLRFLRW
ncbi:hypothetical protein BJV78DRAFT_1283035 [Lactifluus subvellereus]|nr:hypothetical protein BJV78DRAFT_1283035 [Lactifluus subvellereus]